MDLVERRFMWTTTILSVIVLCIAVFLWIEVESGADLEEKSEEITPLLELKQDLLYLNRQVNSLPNEKAVEEVLELEKRYLQLEKESAFTKVEQRWLSESHDLLLHLHEELKEKGIQKADYPRKDFVY